jgi:DNA polymerase III gamma/tau subunit
VAQEGIQVEADALSLWYEATGGSMRRLMASVDMIRAAHAGRTVKAKTITGVAEHLWGMAIGRAA